MPRSAACTELKLKAKESGATQNPQGMMPAHSATARAEREAQKNDGAEGDRAAVYQVGTLNSEIENATSSGRHEKAPAGFFANGSTPHP